MGGPMGDRDVHRAGDQILDAGPSPHLTWAELGCHDAARTSYPVRWRQRRARRLAAVFEAIRHACGDHPLRVLSGYRTPAHNRGVGGARHSQHVQGRAIDLAPPRGWTVTGFHAVVRAVARADRKIGAVGYYRWGVHVDIRARRKGRLVAWHGRAVRVRV